MLYVIDCVSDNSIMVVAAAYLLVLGLAFGRLQFVGAGGALVCAGLEITAGWRLLFARL